MDIHEVIIPVNINISPTKASVSSTRFIDINTNIGNTKDPSPTLFYLYNSIFGYGL